MASTMREKSAELVTRLTKESFPKTRVRKPRLYGTRIDITQSIFSVALDIIGIVGFNYHFNSTLGEGKTSALEQAFHDCLHTLTAGTPYQRTPHHLRCSGPVEFIGRLFRIKEQRLLDN